ncbi:MAG: hypothetical protein AAF843_07745, partial [Bacteroidota bacterium]
DDSIMTVLNPLSVKGKNSILVKFDDQVLRVTVELKESKVAAEFSSSTLYDVVFPTSLDPFQMIDLVSDERYQLDALALDDINAVITSSTNCRPCVKQLTNYLSNGSSEDDLNVIYIFPENTTLASIDKYVQIVKSNESNIKFLKGDINAFRKRYGLLGLPDGILVDKNGGLVKNHFTLNNKKPI